jgi:peptidoglycan/LPS O-acetylase OafA/YrhL
VKEVATRIPSLDGIRAASVMLVFALHAGFVREAVGDLGVNVFFFLSGYLIATLLGMEYEATGSVSIRHFAMRRALRILPPFYTVALAATVMTLFLYPPGTVYGPSLASQLLFYFNYYSLYGIHRGIPGLGVVWSLAVEEHFYLLFPLLYVAMQASPLARRYQAWLLWGLCAAILAWRFFLVSNAHADMNRIYPTTDTRVDSILFGCALAAWYNPYSSSSVRDNPATLPWRWKYLFLPAAVAAVVWCVTFRDPLFQITASFSVQGVALSILFIAVIRFYDWPPFRVLNWRPVVFIGTLSYSLYLVHDVFLRATAQLWPHAHAWQRALVGLTASFIASLAIYVAIEMPCASLRKKLMTQTSSPWGMPAMAGAAESAESGIRQIPNPTIKS